MVTTVTGEQTQERKLIFLIWRRPQQHVFFIMLELLSEKDISFEHRIFLRRRTLAWDVERTLIRR
jgi:hypothetical protein